MTVEENRRFEFDVYRTIVLGKMISRWGIPDERRNFVTPQGIVEIYRIPSQQTPWLVRYATFGLSQIAGIQQRPDQHELLLVIDEGNGKATSAQALECMSELTAYYLQLSSAIELPSVTPESDVMPWKPKALLFDEARGEDDDLATIKIGLKDVKLVWVVPIYQNECELINRGGIEEFDRLCAARNIDLVNVSRNSVVEN